MFTTFVFSGENEVEAARQQPRSQGSRPPAPRNVGRVGENPGNEIGSTKQILDSGALLHITTRSGFLEGWLSLN